ncbi:hypothetical protein FB446DRAFT_224796 [Lentinula raphanica]|nr:hypothetical protein FB446DRAFT_224796 [Lentinula raphanica]
MRFHTRRGLRAAILSFFSFLCTAVALPTNPYKAVSHTSYPSFSPMNYIYLVNSQMAHRPLNSVGVQYEWVVSIWFSDPPRTRFAGDLINKDIVAALKPHVAPDVLFYFPSRGLIPYWDKFNQLKFNIYLTRNGLADTSNLGNLRPIGFGYVTKLDSDIQTKVSFQKLRDPTLGETSSNMADHEFPVYTKGKCQIQNEFFSMSTNQAMEGKC